MSVSIDTVGGEAVHFLEDANGSSGLAAENAGHREFDAGGDQMLLRPDHHVAAALALQQRVDDFEPVAGDRLQGAVGADRPPLTGRWSPASTTSSAPGRRSWRRSGGRA